MSYSESFSASIQVSGSVTVNYPPSESGGSKTVSYSETVPVHWTVYVNTDPFDNSVRQTEAAVSALTGSVVAMSAAEVASIRESSQRVAGKLTEGFYSLIGKDLSETLTKQINVIKSKFALLMQYSRDLTDKCDRMEADVARLKRHYHAVFHGLDEDMARSISRLDHDSYLLGRKMRQELVEGPFLDNAAFSLNQLQEGSRSSVMLLNARTHGGISSTIRTIGEYVKQNAEYRDKMTAILDKEKAEDAVKEYVPVVLCTGADLNTRGNGFMRCFIPEMEGRNRIGECVCRHAVSIPPEQWKRLDPAEMDSIDRSFRNFVETDSKSDSSPESSRVYQLMLRMWNERKNDLRGI